MNAEIVTLVSEGDPPAISRPVTGGETEKRIRDLMEQSGIQVLSTRRVVQESWLLEQILAESATLFDLVLVLDASKESGEKLMRKILAQISGRGLVLEENLLRNLRNLYQSKGDTLPRDIESRALLPKNAHWIPPKNGVRPGVWMDIKGKYLLVLPDEIREAEQMWAWAQSAWFGKSRGAEYHTRSLPLRFVGRAPSRIESSLHEAAEGAKLSVFSEGCVCSATISVEGKNLERVQQELERIRKRVLGHLEEEFFAEGEETLEAVVGRLLIENSRSISIAESCTGGLITSLLVEVPEISSVLDRGVITYSNEAKTALLGVPEEVIMAHGAVSRVVARAMASGVRDSSGTEIGLAVTGIAGPGGGTPEKPVGTVFIGISTPEGNEVMEYHFQGDRQTIRMQSAQMALDRVRRYLLRL
jgi:nicotinamide-nucleotide amidase